MNVEKYTGSIRIIKHAAFIAQIRKKKKLLNYK